MMQRIRKVLPLVITLAFVAFMVAFASEGGGVRRP